jgi:hypothetical protein
VVIELRLVPKVLGSNLALPQSTLHAFFMLNEAMTFLFIADLPVTQA